MDPVTEAEAEHRVEVFRRMAELITEQDGQRALETVQTYADLWSARLEAARLGGSGGVGTIPVQSSP